MKSIPVKYYPVSPGKFLYFSIGIILALVVSSGIFYYFWKINVIDYLPGFSICPFHALTGKHCPGCGMSRAFLLLGQLRAKEALEMNLFSVPLLLLMITYLVFRRVPLWLQNKHLINLSLFAVLTFWIFRLFNI